MYYDKVILEMLDRIKTLEENCEQLKNRISEFEKNTLPANDEKPARISLTDEMIDACYRAGKEFFNDNTINSLKKANEISLSTGINEKSAYMYINAVKAMLSGEIFKRAISNRATERYFKYILDDYGKEGLKKALESVKEHIKYRQQCGLIVDGLEKLCEKTEKTFDIVPNNSVNI